MSYPQYYQPVPQSPHCANHPEREGIGICVSCRSVVCVECSTKIDRMNYCVRCLEAAQQPQAQAKERPALETALAIPLLLGALLAAAGVFAAFGFLLVYLRHLAPGGVAGG